MEADRASMEPPNYYFQASGFFVFVFPFVMLHAPNLTTCR